MFSDQKLRRQFPSPDGDEGAFPPAEAAALDEETSEVGVGAASGIVDGGVGLTGGDILAPLAPPCKLTKDANQQKMWAAEECSSGRPVHSGLAVCWQY